MKARWSLAMIPAGIGLVMTILLNSVADRNPVLYIKADLGTLLFLLGVIVSILWGAYFALEAWSSRFQKETQLQAGEERRRFLRRLDHELKNPLTAIRAAAANIADAPTQESRQEALESINAQALRLSRLSADLRKLAELESRPIERNPVDVGELLQEVFTLTQDQPDAQERRLVLSIPRAPWPLPKIHGDPDLLFLALHNLLDNALKFTQPGNTVEVRAFEDGSTVVMEVADTGPGIPEDELPHVWEELYRGRSARGIPGSGLGLALVRAITERHGGSLSLRSRESQGTVFSVRLPAG